MKSVLGIFLLSSLMSLVYSQQQLTPPTPTTAEMFPYHAVIETVTRNCNGALIAKNFVLTRASCVHDDTVIAVYLGFSRNPTKSENIRNDPNGQIFEAEQVYIHDDYGTLEATNQKINNLALIKLTKDIVPTRTISPVGIAAFDNFPIPPGTFINQTGYKTHATRDTLRYATVQEKDLDVCDVFYGNSFLRSQERCVKQRGLERSKWTGPYVVNGVLVGLSRSIQASASCYITSPPCDVNDVYISLEPFLLWIYRISGAVGVKGKALFERDNPHWKPKDIDTGSHKPGTKPVEECTPTTHNGSSNFDRDSLMNVIREGLFLGMNDLSCS